MEELRLRWQGRLLCKTKHPAHWLVNVLRQKTMHYWLPVAFRRRQMDLIGPGHQTHVRRPPKWGNNVRVCSAFLPPKTQPNASQPDRHSPGHSLTIESYNYKKALYTRLLKRLCNFTLTTAISILKSHQQACPATKRVLVVDTVSNPDLAAMTCKNALCCQKFFLLKSKGTPSSGTRCPPN